MSSHTKPNTTNGTDIRDVLVVESDTQGVFVSATSDQIKRSFREGDDLVIVLSDGKLLVLQSYYAWIQPPAVLARDADLGTVIVLKVTEEGEFLGYEPVVRGQIAEMFSVVPSEPEIVTQEALEEEADQPSELGPEPEQEEELELSLPDLPEVPGMTGEWLTTIGLASIAAAYSGRDDDEGGLRVNVSGRDTDGDGILDFVDVDTDADGSADYTVELATERLEIFGDYELDQRGVQRLRSWVQQVEGASIETVRVVDLGARSRPVTLRVDRSALNALADTDGDGDYDASDGAYTLTVEGGSGDVIEFENGIVFQIDAAGAAGNVYQDHRGVQYVVDAAVGASGAGFYSTPLAAIVGNVDAVNLVMLGATDVGDAISENNLTHFRALLGAIQAASGNRAAGAAAGRSLAGESEVANAAIPARVPTLSQLTEEDLVKLAEYVNDYVQGTDDRGDISMTASITGRTLTMTIVDRDGTDDKVVEVEFAEPTGASQTSLDAAVVTQRLDTNDDGRVERVSIDGTTGQAADGTADQYEDFEYDANGRVTSIKLDTDASDDGVYEGAETFAYMGNATRSERDADADGTPERIRHDADSDGNAERVEHDADEDGTAERIQYDDDDNGSVDRTAHDDNGDGTAERTVHNPDQAGVNLRTEHDADGDGNAERTERDADGDGTPESIVYDDNDDGIADATEHDDDDDGTVERTVYDDNGDGRPDRTEAGPRIPGLAGTPADTDGNGTPDQYTFDADGNGTVERTEYDTDENGTVERIAYDADETGTAERTDYDADESGVAERIEYDADESGTAERVAYDADETGTAELVSHDADEDGTPERIEYDLDETGTVERTAHDDDDDGNIDRILYDADADGTPELALLDSDDDGNIDRISHDPDGNGTTDRIEDFVYGTDGHLATKSIDSNGSIGDGNYEIVETYTYGTDGRITRIAYDLGEVTESTQETPAVNPDDGSRVEILTQQKDANGLNVFDENGMPVFVLIPANDVSITSERGTVDGSADRHEDFEYDSNGRLIKKSVDSEGSIGDGAYEQVEYYFYSPGGDLIRTEYDIPSAAGDSSGTADSFDGTPERVHYHYYPDRARNLFVPSLTEAEAIVDLSWWRGRVSKREFDTDFSSLGWPERTEEYFYDSNGSHEFTWVEVDGDGATDWQISYVWDGTQLQEMRYDYDRDGQFDYRETYNANLEVTSTVTSETVDGRRVNYVDTDADGTIDEENFATDGTPDGTVSGTEDVEYIARFVNDANGNRIMASFDDGANGSIDRIETYEYDGRGNRIRTNFDDNADGNGQGSYERIETYVYDNDDPVWEGIHLRTIFDSNADGSPDRVEHYNVYGDIEEFEDWVYASNMLTVNYYSIVDKPTGEVYRHTFNNVVMYDQTKILTFDGSGGTSIQDTLYRVGYDEASGGINRIPIATRYDTNGDGIVDSVRYYSSGGSRIQPDVTLTRASVEFDAANGLSYDTVTRGSDSTFSEIWLPAESDFSFEPSAVDGTSWQNVDTITLYDMDDVDLDPAGAEGLSGDATLILTDEFIEAMMTGRGADDHVIILGDAGDTIRMNLSRYALAVIQHVETHQWFEILDPDGTPATVTGTDSGGEPVTGPGRHPKQFAALLAIDDDITLLDLSDTTAPVDPEPTSEPGPVDPGPVDPGPVDPGPVDPGPVDPGPVEPEPVDPAPVDPGPVDPGPSGPTVTSSDTDGDGTDDRFMHDIDADGTIDRTEYDADEDGTPERVEYDQDGNGTVDLTTSDSDGDGYPDLWEWDTDEDGTANFRGYDTDNNGTVNYYENRFNRGGAALRFDYDRDENGTIDLTAFDSDGDRRAELLYFDTDEDGTPEATGYDTDDDGRVNYYEIDSNQDGTLDGYVLDEDDNGSPDFSQVDSDLNGVFETAIRAPDNAGSRALFVNYQIVSQPAETISYDRLGRISAISVDSDQNGTAEEHQTYVYNSFDPLGRLVEDAADSALDEGGIDGSLDDIHYHFHGAYIPTSADGRVRVVTAATPQSEGGLPTSIAIDFNGDGTVDAQGAPTVDVETLSEDVNGTTTELLNQPSVQTVFFQPDDTVRDPEDPYWVEHLVHGYTGNLLHATVIAGDSIYMHGSFAAINMAYTYGTIDSLPDSDLHVSRIQYDVTHGTGEDATVDREWGEAFSYTLRTGPDEVTQIIDTIKKDIFSTNHDGTADPDRTELYHYDDNGMIERVEIDSTGTDGTGTADGTYDSTETYFYGPGAFYDSYRDAGKMFVYKTVDDDRDGTADGLIFANGVTYAFAPDADEVNAWAGITKINLSGTADDPAYPAILIDGATTLAIYNDDLSVFADRDGDGAADTGYTLVIDSDGTNDVVQLGAGIYAIADGADGSSDSEGRKGYQGSDGIIYIDSDIMVEAAQDFTIRTEHDSNSDGTPERITHDFDNDGTFELVEIDANNNGSFERTEYDTNDDGTADRIAYDDDDNGTIDRIVHDVNGAGVNVRTDYDDDDNGTIDRTGYDADGDGTSERTVYNATGGTTGIRTEFDADDNGITERIEHDSDNDGTPERIESGYEWDANDDGTPTFHAVLTALDSDDDGKIDQISHDPDGDGTANIVEDFEYDANGRLNAKGIDTGGSVGTVDRDGDGTANDRIETVDGVYDEIETYRYEDATDRLVRTEYDTDADDTADRYEDYEYDENGRLTRTKIDFRTSMVDGTEDTLGDGTAETVENYYYNDNGSIDRIEYDTTRVSRARVDGSIDRIWYHYNADRELSPYIPGLTERESHVDLTYDTMGRVSFREYDTSFLYFRTASSAFERNHFERTERYSYVGNTDRLESIDIDTNADGVVDENMSFLYDSVFLHQIEYDTDNDSSVDYKETYNHSLEIVSTLTYEYTSDGRINYSDTNADGKVDNEYISGSYYRVYEYSANGNHVATKFDDNDDLDGEFDRIETYEYDGRGNRIKISFDTNASDDGVYERIETYVFDTEDPVWDGILLRTEFDEDADGSKDRVEHYDIHGQIDSVEDWTYGTSPTTHTIKYAESVPVFVMRGGERIIDRYEPGVTDADGTVQYEREKVVTFGADGTTVSSIVETEYDVSGTSGSGSRTLVTTITDSDGDGFVNTVATVGGSTVTYTRTPLEFDAANRLSYQSVTKSGTTFRELWFPAEDDFSFEPSAADGTAWQNVDTITLFNKDDIDFDPAGSEGLSGDATLILTDEFIEAMMTGRGADDHVMIWGDEGDTVQMNSSRFALAIIQHDDTHQWFEILDFDSTPSTVTGTIDGEAVSGPGRHPKLFDALLAIDSDITIVDIPVG